MMRQRPKLLRLGLIRRVASVALLGWIVGGCSSRSPNSPPFEWGGESAAPIVKLPISIVEPHETVVIPRRKAFHSTVDLTAAGSVKRPIAMVAYLIPTRPQIRREIFGGEFAPFEQHGSTFTFRSKVRMPDEPGTYRLRVATTYSRGGRERVGGDPSLPTDERPTYFDDGALIQVN